MIREIVAQLRKRAMEIADALKSKFLSATHWSTPAISSSVKTRTLIVASAGNGLDMGKRYRKTSGHAPLFSLYTFFGNR
jgi:hypothetical protein